MKQFSAKAFFFSVDALAASMIIVFGILAFSSDLFSQNADFDINLLADDAIDVLSEIKVGEIEDPYIDSLVADGNLTTNHMNNTVLEQILIFWAEGKPEIARTLLNITLTPELKGNYRFGFFADNNESLFNDSTINLDNLMVYKKFVSGIEEGKKTHGFMTKVSFTDIHSKQTSLYHYFGGFVGQGNVTANMSLQNLTDSEIISMELELDVASDFLLYVNGNLVGLFNHAAGYKEADTWIINDSTSPSLDDSWFVEGDNLITLDFLGQMNESYIGGGYLKITYETRNKKDPYTRFKGGDAIKRIPLSGISGAINLYDSFYIPGEINSMKVHFDYIAEHSADNSSSLFFNIGNTTVYRSSNFTLSHHKETLTNFSQINLSDMGFETVPYRVGYSNLSYVVESSNHSGAGDAILVTDRSGSMQWVFYQNNDNGNYRDVSYEQCTEQRLNDPDVSRIYVARCVDKEFSSDMVLSSPYNRVGLASYDSNLLGSMDLNDGYSPLKDRIEQYEASGGTCTACGIWSGIQTLLQSSNSIIAKMISRNDEWSYYENFTPDPSWTTRFNESWQTGNAILGSGDVNTLLYTSEIPISLWGGNDSTIDFSSGVNMSGSTFHYELNKSLSQFTIENGEWTTSNLRLTENFSELKDWNFVDLDDSAGTEVSANGKLILSAGGDDTWMGADEYASVFRKVKGDFQATVKIDYQENSDPWSKAGIMVKNSMQGSGSSQGYVFLAMTPGNGFSLQHDSNDDGFLDSSTTASASNPPDWIRLQKEDQVFTAYYSDDGINWNYLGSCTSSHALSVQDIGLSVTSHDTDLSEVHFDHFELERPGGFYDYFNRHDNDYTGYEEHVGNWYIDDYQLRHTDNTIPGNREEGFGPYMVYEGFGDYNVTTRIYPGDDDTMGLLFRYQDENNYYRFRFDNTDDFVRVEKIENGVRTILTSNEASNLGFDEGDWHILKIVARGDHFEFYRGSNLIGTVNDPTFSWGGVAPYAWGMDDARFDHVIIEKKSLANATFGAHVSEGYVEAVSDSTLNCSLDSDTILSGTGGAYIPRSGYLNCTGEHITDFNLYSDTFDGWDKHNSTYASHDTGCEHGYDGDGIYVQCGPQYFSGMVSGSWGHEFYVEEFNNKTILSFSFDFDDLDDNLEEEACVIARLSDPKQSIYLGEEVAPFTFNTMPAVWCQDSMGDHSGNVTIDLTPYIDNQGSYYLDFGLLLEDTSYSTEGARVTFDDINLRHQHTTNPGTYYFQKKVRFYPPLSYYKDPVMRLRTDDSADVFINGIKVYNNTPQTGKYWNDEVDLSKSYFREGENLVAVRLNNNITKKAEFDMELTVNYTDPKRGKAVLLMSDGVATSCANSALHGSSFYCNDCAGRPCCPDDDGNLNQPCPDYPSLNDEAEQALGMACWANDNYNISIYTVMFGDDPAGIHAMNMTATICDNESNFYQSSNYSGISEIYRIIATRMLEDFSGNFTRQSLVVGDDFGKSELKPTSYLEFNYTPSYRPRHDDIFISANTLPFQNTFTNGSFHYAGHKKLLDAGISSFSGDHWTSQVILNNGTNNTVFYLGDYGNVFKRLGDPYRVGIPVHSLARNKTNRFFIHTGKNATEKLNGSIDDRFFYSFVVEGLGISPTVNPSAEGCAWNVTYLDKTSAIIPIPEDYTGSKVCYYHNATYDINDSIDQAAYQLFSQLDVEGNKRLVIKLDRDFLQVRTSTVGYVPSLWGPSMAEARVWK